MDSQDDEIDDYPSGARRKANSSSFKPHSKVVKEELKKPPKRKMSFQQYYNRMTQSPKMTTKTRFRWRYKNRLCLEQKTVQHIGGKQIPVSSQMLYMTDSSDDNEQPMKGPKTDHVTDEEPETHSNMSDDEEHDASHRSRCSSRNDDIEWDYSDIKLTVGESFGEVDGYVKVKGQMLPNFELFEDVSPQPERPRRRTERRSRKSRDEKSTEIVTKYGFHITKRLPRGREEYNQHAGRNLNRNISTRSDSGYLDVASGSTSAPDSKRETSLDETEDDVFAQRSLNQSRESELNRSAERGMKQDQNGAYQDDLKTHTHCENVLPSPFLHHHSTSALPTLSPRFTHDENDMVVRPKTNKMDPKRDKIITEQDFEDSLELSAERRDPHVLKNRSRSLEQFTESSFYDSLECSPRSRHNKSMEFINKHYDISCSLCKIRKKCEHRKTTGILHPMGTLRRENAFIKEETAVKSDNSDNDSVKSQKTSTSLPVQSTKNSNSKSKARTIQNTKAMDTEHAKSSFTPRSRSSSHSEQVSTPRSARSWHRPGTKHHSVYELLKEKSGDKFEPSTPRSEGRYLQRFTEHLARRERHSSAEKPRINLFRSASFNDNLHAVERATHSKIVVRRSPSLEHVGHLGTGSIEEHIPQVPFRERTNNEIDLPHTTRKRESKSEPKPTPKMEDKSTQHEHVVTSDDSDCVFETKYQLTLTQSVRDPNRKKGKEKSSKSKDYSRESSVSGKSEPFEEMNLTQDSLETSTSTTSSYTNTSTYTSSSSTTTVAQPEITQNPPRPSRVAILDFSEMVPTITVKSRSKDKSRDTEKSQDRPPDQSDPDMDKEINANEQEKCKSRTNEQRPTHRVLAPDVIVPAVEDVIPEDNVPNEVHDWSFDASDRAGNTSSDDGSDTPTENDAMLRLLIPVHMYRTSCNVDYHVLNSFMELWFSQLLGMHRTILITKLMDYFSRWHITRQRHVSVLYRDNFLVVSDRSDSMDQSDGPSFDLSWSPEFMSTPRDVAAVDGQAYVQINIEDISDSSIERSHNVSEALARLTSHRRDRTNAEGAQDVYSKYERTSRTAGGHARQFKDLEFSLESSSSTAENTSIWDSHIDSGYEIIHERKRNRSQDAIYNSSSYSSDSSATFRCEDHEDQEMTFNSTISPNTTLKKHQAKDSVIISQGDTIIVDGKGRGKKRYATTMVISKYENSDGTASEYSDAESIASTVSSCSHRYVSACNVPVKSEGLRKVYISRPTNLRPGLEIGLHRYVCLDMPLKIYPETDTVSNVLHVEYIEEDFSASFNTTQQNTLPWVRVEQPRSPDTQAKLFQQKYEVNMNESLDSTLSQDSADITDVTIDSTHDESKCLVAAKIKEKDHESDVDTSQTEVSEKYRVELQMRPSVQLQKFHSELQDVHLRVEKPDDLLQGVHLDSHTLQDGTNVHLGNMTKMNSPALEGYRSFTVPHIDEQNGSRDSTQDDVTTTNTYTWDAETCGSSFKTEGEMLSTQPTSEVTTDTSESESKLISEPTPKHEAQSTRPMMKKPPLPKCKSLDTSDSDECGYSVTMQFHDAGVPIMSYDPSLHLTPYHFDSRLKKFYDQLASERRQIGGGYMSGSTQGSRAPYEEMETNFGAGTDSDTSTESQEQKASSMGVGLDLANCPISKVVDHILGANKSTDDTFMQFKEYTSLSDSKQFDGSRDTLNDTEDEANAINRTMSQLESVTKILRVMDFASDGVDILLLLKKFPRSKSCPDISVFSFETEVVKKEEVKEEGKRYTFSGGSGSVYVDKDEMDLLAKLSATPEVTKHGDVVAEGGSAEEAVSDQLESSERTSSKPSSQQTPAIASSVDTPYNTDTGTMEYISDIGGSGGTPCRFQSDEETTLTAVTNDVDTSESQSTNVTKPQQNQQNEQSMVLKIHRQEEQSEQMLAVKFIDQDGQITVSEVNDIDQDNAMVPHNNTAASIEEFDEEKSISVNVSFEIGYKQRVPSVEDLQRLIKDCQQIRDGLMQDVARMTREMSEEIEQNVSDESLQIEWLYNDKNEETTAAFNINSENNDEILCVSIGRRNSQKLLDVLDKDLSMLKGGSQVGPIPVEELGDDRVLQCGQLMSSFVPVDEQESAKTENSPNAIEDAESDTGSVDVPVTRISNFEENNGDESELNMHKNEEVESLCRMLGVDFNECERVVEEVLSGAEDQHTECQFIHGEPQRERLTSEPLDGSSCDEILLLQGNSQASSHDGQQLTSSLTESQETLSQNDDDTNNADSKSLPIETADGEQEKTLDNESEVSDADVNGCEPNYSLLSMSSLSGGLPTPRVHHMETFPEVDKPQLWKGSMSDDEHIMYVDDSLRTAFALHVGMDLADLFGDEAFDDDEWHSDSSDGVKIRRSMSARDLSDRCHNHYYLNRSRQTQENSQNTSREIDEEREEQIEMLLSKEPIFIRPHSVPESLSDDNSNSYPIVRHRDKLLYIPPQGEFIVGFDGDAITDEEGNCYTQSEGTGKQDTTFSSINTSTSYEEVEEGLVKSSASVTLQSLPEDQREFSHPEIILQRLDNINAIVFQDSTHSHSSRHEVDYGKFYNTSYLEKPMGVAKGPSINPSDRKPTHFHRPENFSYSQVRKDFIIPMKKESSSMMSALGDATKVTKKCLEDFMEEPMKNKDVIEMAKFPDSQKREESEPLPIEREDWPAPAAAAAAYPELLYKHTKTSRRSRGESSEMDSTDGGHASSVDIDMEEEEREVDPRIIKDIEHLSRLESESGAAKVILEDLKKKAAEPPPLIDVISASRTPSAATEPVYRTRYESHVFASPSRDLDYQPRTYALDDQILGRKYRNALQSVGNYPVDRRGYERPTSLSHRKAAMKPGYTLRAPKTAHMPSTFASARANGYFSDIEQCVTRDSDFDEVMERRSHKTPSIHTSQSSIEEYDPVTGLRRGGKLRGSSLSTDYSKTPFRKSISSVLNKDDPPKIYSYEELKLSNPELPPGTDINWLEVHLEDNEFQRIFNMSREEFYRLAEWKRNDLKKRVLLF